MWEAYSRGGGPGQGAAPQDAQSFIPPGAWDTVKAGQLKPTPVRHSQTPVRGSNDGRGSLRLFALPWKTDTDLAAAITQSFGERPPIPGEWEDLALNTL